jgi:anti-anti-sigma factor
MVTFKRAGDTLHCYFSGRLDTPVCQEIEPLLAEQLEDIPAYVVFDLKDVDYISSMFFRMCIQTNKQLDTGAFSVRHTKPDVKNVFRIAGLSQMLNVT